MLFRSPAPSRSRVAELDGAHGAGHAEVGHHLAGRGSGLLNVVGGPGGGVAEDERGYNSSKARATSRRCDGKYGAPIKALNPTIIAIADSPIIRQSMINFTPRRSVF